MASLCSLFTGSIPVCEVNHLIVGVADHLEAACVGLCPEFQAILRNDSGRLERHPEFVP